jgi:hypothetical protein
VILVVDELFVLVIVRELLCYVWEVGGVMMVIIVELRPETVSEKSVAVLAIYSYSLGAALRGVR